MLQVYICIGNACRLKWSSQIIKAFQELIEKNSLEDRVELMESYCQGHCRRGVSVKVGAEYIVDINMSNVEEKFIEYILNRFVEKNHVS